MLCIGLFNWNTTVQHSHHDLHGTLTETHRYNTAILICMEHWLKHTGTTHPWWLTLDIFSKTQWHNTHMICMGPFLRKHTSTTHTWVLFTEINAGTTHTWWPAWEQREVGGLTAWAEGSPLRLEQYCAIKWCSSSLKHKNRATYSVADRTTAYSVSRTTSTQSLASTTSTQSLASTTSTVTGLYNFHTVTGLYNFHTVTGLHNFHSHWLITQLPHSHWPLACTLTTYSLAYCTTATYLQAVYDCIFTGLLYIYYVLTDCSTTTYSLTSTMTATYSLACTAVKHRAIAATRPAPNRNRASLKCHWTTSWISLMSVKNFTDIFNVSEELHGYL